MPNPRQHGFQVFLSESAELLVQHVCPRPGAGRAVRLDRSQPQVQGADTEVRREEQRAASFEETNTVSQIRLEVRQAFGQVL